MIEPTNLVLIPESSYHFCVRIFPQDAHLERDGNLNTLPSEKMGIMGENHNKSDRNFRELALEPICAWYVSRVNELKISTSPQDAHTIYAALHAFPPSQEISLLVPDRWKPMIDHIQGLKDERRQSISLLVTRTLQESFREEVDSLSEAFAHHSISSLSSDSTNEQGTIDGETSMERTDLHRKRSRYPDDGEIDLLAPLLKKIKT